MSEVLPRVLLISRALTSDGISRHVLTLHNGLGVEGIATHLAAPNPPDDLPSTHHLPVPHSLGQRGPLRSYRQGLRSIVRSLNPDIIHFHNRAPLAAAVGATGGRAILYTRHSVASGLSAIERYTVDGIVDVADHLRSPAGALLRRRMSVIENGVADVSFSGLAYDLAFVGRDDTNKRPGLAVDAARIAGRILNRTLTMSMFGEGLGRYQSHDALLRVTTHGCVGEWNHLGRPGLLIISSRSEGQPLAGLEALAGGVPVVTTPGTQLYPRHGRGIGVAEEDTPLALGTLIARTLSEGLDQSQQDARFEYEKRFRSERMLRDLAEVYRQLVPPRNV